MDLEKMVEEEEFKEIIYYEKRRLEYKCHKTGKQVLKLLEEEVCEI